MKKRLIIDTNLLLLFIIGAVEEGRHIQNSNRLSKFNKSDYFKIVQIISEYDELHITPYIVTEVSNLIDLNGHAKTIAYEIAQNLFCNFFKKIDIKIEEDCNSEFFLKFGITDSSLVNLASNFYILTNDHRLLTALYTKSTNHIIPYPI